ncbi:MAG: hypothetical protein IPL21_19505 [Saprospirales bacterium]|nr:hypothetical protein [Saprospirales bacterium]
MKNKRLIISTVIFFLTVNTTYYWESKLGIFAFPVFLILAVVYFVLVIALLRQIYFVVKEKFSDKTQLLIIGFLTLLLTLTFFRPFGIVNFNKLERGDILVAEREGAVNCMTTFKLKDNFTFSERNICFGVTEIKGKYYLQYDTIFLTM